MNLNLLSEENITALRQLIAGAERIIIVTHRRPDGDAIGSSLGWCGYLKALGKQVTCVVPDAFPDFLRWVPGADMIVRNDKAPEKVKALFDEADLIFCLDFNTPSRIGDEFGEQLVATEAKRVLIDHHIAPDVPATLTVSFPEMSSTCELVFRLISQLDGYDLIDNPTAQAIYCGMMTDTGGFVYNSTRPEIYFIIGELLAKGIDKDKIYRNVYNTFSENRLRLIGYVLYQKLNVLTPLCASFYSISKADQKRFNYIRGDAEGIVNMPLQMKGHKLSISLREDTEKPDTIWVSLRSVDDFPCNEMAERFFNGGGHKNASGGCLNCSLPEAEQIVRQAVKAYADMLR